jgi:hypothetical protein
MKAYASTAAVIARTGQEPESALRIVTDEVPQGNESPAGETLCAACADPHMVVAHSPQTIDLDADDLRAIHVGCSRGRALHLERLVPLREMANKSKKRLAATTATSLKE